MDVPEHLVVKQKVFRELMDTYCPAQLTLPRPIGIIDAAFSSVKGPPMWKRLLTATSNRNHHPRLTQRSCSQKAVVISALIRVLSKKSLSGLTTPPPAKQQQKPPEINDLGGVTA